MKTSELAVQNDPLNARQRAFVNEDMLDRNAPRAYVDAGYAARGRVAEVNASRLLQHADVSRAIAAFEATTLIKIQNKTGITLERTLTEIARGAFFDVRKLFNDDGSPKGINELDDETASAIEGIDVVEQFQGTGEDRVFIGHIKKYKLAKRSTSLDMLMKHLNGYKDDNKSKGEGTANALVTLLMEMKRSSLPIVHEVPRDDSL